MLNGCQVLITFTGKIDNITSKSYIICCKPDGKMYRVIKLVSLNVEGFPKIKDTSLNNFISDDSNLLRIKTC